MIVTPELLVDLIFYLGFPLVIIGFFLYTMILYPISVIVHLPNGRELIKRGFKTKKGKIKFGKNKFVPNKESYIQTVVGNIMTKQNIHVRKTGDSYQLLKYNYDKSEFEEEETMDYNRFLKTGLKDGVELTKEEKGKLERLLPMIGFGAMVVMFSIGVLIFMNGYSEFAVGATPRQICKCMWNGTVGQYIPGLPPI